MERPWDDLMHRADKDDCAATAPGTGRLAFQKLTYRSTGAKKLTGEIDVDNRLPIGQRHVLDGRSTLDARVIDQKVKPREPLARLREHRLHLSFVAYVRGNRYRLAAATD